MPRPGRNREVPLKEVGGFKRQSLIAVDCHTKFLDEAFYSFIHDPSLAWKLPQLKFCPRSARI
jgi:hypothetical protein